MSNIEIVEVGARDGLQNEAVLFSTEQKIELIKRAIGAGVRRVEVASFVNPRLVPQMADAEAVVAGLRQIYVGLVLNKHGARRAIESGVHELSAVCAASDGFATRNQGQTAAQSLKMCCEVVRLARDAGRRGQITIAAAFGCPLRARLTRITSSTWHELPSRQAPSKSPLPTPSEWPPHATWLTS